MATAASAVLLVALPGCGGDEGGSPPVSLERLDQGDTLIGQGTEIIDGRFVPELVAVSAAQPVRFVNRDGVAHRIVKVSGPGQDFRSELLQPGESYRLSLVGRPGQRLRDGTVVYRSPHGREPRGRIKVTGMLLRRSAPSERRAARPTPPARPDWAARRRARDLAPYVSQCHDFRRCDTGEELVRNVGSGHAVQFVPGSGEKAVTSAVATHSPDVRMGSGPDETEIDATRHSFTIVSHSRTGRDFVLHGRGRDPRGWSSRWVPES